MIINTQDNISVSHYLWKKCMVTVGLKPDSLISFTYNFFYTTFERGDKNKPYSIHCISVYYVSISIEVIFITIFTCKIPSI